MPWQCIIILTTVFFCQKYEKFQTNTYVSYKVLIRDINMTSTLQMATSLHIRQQFITRRIQTLKFSIYSPSFYHCTKHGSLIAEGACIHWGIL